MIFADTDVFTGHELGAALADEDRAGVDDAARVLLDTEPLPGGVAAVAGRACAFFVCPLYASIFVIRTVVVFERWPVFLRDRCLFL